MKAAAVFLGLLAALAGAAPAHAVFFRTQMERIDPEPLFDSEYFLDLLAFREPLEAQELWEASTAPAYRINAASLDCCSLLLRQELVFPKQLTPTLGFRYHLAHSEDKDRQELHQWLTLERAVGAGFSAVVFGEPTFRKEDSDVGAGLAYRGRRWSAVARRNFVDFNFNQRGVSGERYDRRPVTDDLALAAWWGPQRLSLWLEFDHPLTRRVPAESRVFSYRRTTLAVQWSRRPPDAWGPRLHYLYETHAKGDLFAPGAAGRSLLYSRRVHEFGAAFEGPAGPRDRIEAGQQFFMRRARSDAPADPLGSTLYRRWELQPYARWRRQLRPGLVSELMPALSFGEDRRFAPPGAGLTRLERVVEAKLGAGLEFRFSSSARLTLNSSFDLDDLHRHLWDGGQVRAIFLF